MRIALGLDVDAVPSFATVLRLEPGARPSALPALNGGDPAPGRIDSLVDAIHDVILEVGEREGVAPAAIALVHPLDWEPRRVQRLHRALDRAELSDVLVLTSAAAAAIAEDAQHPLSNGRRVTVVAVRPDGADVQALRKDGEHSFRPLGAPVPVDGVTEGELDALLMALVEAKLPGRLPSTHDDPVLQAAFIDLGDAVHVARQTLCSEDSAIVAVRLPGRAAVIQVQREEFHVAAAPLLAAALPALLTAIQASAASTGGVDQLILTGTAAPTPLLAEMLTAELRVPVVVAGPRDGGSFAAALAAGASAPGGLRAASAAAAPEPRHAAEPAVTVTPVPRVIPVAASRAAAPAETPASGADDALRDEFAHESEPDSERARRPLTLLQLWPITAAAAVLVALAGTASSGVLDLTPAGDHPTTGVTAPAGRTINTVPDTPTRTSEVGTPQPTATVPAVPSNNGTTTKKKTGTKGSTGSTSPGTPSTPASPVSTPSSTPTPVPTTPSPSPTPTPTDTPTLPPLPIPLPPLPIP